MKFNKKLYLQIGGITMATSFAPSLANLFMESCASQLISNFHFKPKVVLRYIDNIFMIWTHGEKSLTEFVNYAISTHRTIKLTSESNAESLVFVHTRVIIDSKIGPYPPSCTLNLLT